MDEEKKRIFIQRIQKLPALPISLARIVTIAEKETSTADELANAISTDQSISSTILRLVNSAFYGRLRQVSSISQSIVILGFKTVKTMALGVSVFRPPSGSGAQVFDRNKFWIHSIGVATIAKYIHQLAPGVAPAAGKDTIFLSGLLHDLGKVVFDNYFNEEYQAVARLALKNGEWIGDVEKREMGIDHCQAGEFLSQKWQFPDAVTDVIKNHHNTEFFQNEGSALTAIVHVADHCCRELALGYGGDNERVPLDPTAVSRLGIDDRILDQIMERMEKERSTVEAFGLGG